MIDDAFGNWPAGFLDGEASFLVRRDTNTGRLYPGLNVGLRADDGPLLRRIMERTGIGTIQGPWETKLGKPVLRWSVQARGDCLVLRDLLQRYPLRSKKRRDFEVWSRAVDAIYAGDQDLLSTLKVEIEQVRRWVDSESQMSVVAPSDRSQMELVLR